MDDFPDIKEWFNIGANCHGVTHLIIAIIDIQYWPSKLVDYEKHPVYVTDEEDLGRLIQLCSIGGHVDKVYDLKLPFEKAELNNF